MLSLIKAVIFIAPLVSVPDIDFEAKMKDVDKISEALFFETRGTCKKDKQAITEVILKRTQLNDFPSSVTKVINQYTWKDGVKVCQFSYMCELNLRNKAKLYRSERSEYVSAQRVAFNAVFFGPTNHTRGADHYFATKRGKPNWYKRSKVTTITCAHTYLKLAKG